jgi:hemerythrin-like domain-containing protein
MMPIGPLMIEHRLIERMIHSMREEVARMKVERKADPLFIETAVDFIKTYADQCHHGKEEDILFRELQKREISEDLKRTMDELVEEHRLGRKTTKDLVDAKKKYQQGDRGALPTIIACMEYLVEFYPKHIEKEDRRFFMPVMRYFSQEEKDAMLNEEYEFDRQFVHKIYQEVVRRAENRFE